MMRKLQQKFQLATAAAVAAVLSLCTGWAAMADDISSPWVDGFNNKVRLVAGKAGSNSGGGEAPLFAGIEISMSPGFKTYWRNPGEAGGVPPEFDFSGSQNVAEAIVLYPAPHRTKDKAGENIAYKDKVIFPVSLSPADPSKPVNINLKAIYGVCKDICIPAEAELSVEIPADAGYSASLAAALAQVPREAADPAQSALSGSGLLGRTVDMIKDPVLTSWRVERAGEKAVLLLQAKDPGGDGGDAFLFSSDGLYMPMTSKEAAGLYRAELTEGAPLSDLAGKKISVTLVGSKGASETFIQLPKDLATP